MAHQCNSREIAISAFINGNAGAEKDAKAAGLKLISSRFRLDLSAHDVSWSDADGKVHRDVVFVELSEHQKSRFCAFLDMGQILPYGFEIVEKIKVSGKLHQIVVSVHGMKYAFLWTKGAMKFPKPLSRNQCAKIDAHLRSGKVSPLPKNVVLHDTIQYDIERPDVMDVAVSVNDALHLFIWQSDLGCFESYIRKHERVFKRTNTPVVFGRRASL